MATLRRVLWQGEMSMLFVLLCVCFAVREISAQAPANGGSFDKLPSNDKGADSSKILGNDHRIDSFARREAGGAIGAGQGNSNNPRVNNHFGTLNKKLNRAIENSPNRGPPNAGSYNAGGNLGGRPQGGLFQKPGGAPGFQGGAAPALQKMGGAPGMNDPQRSQQRSYGNQNGAQPVMAGRSRRPPPVKIAEHPSCAQDVKNLCSSSSHTNNFAVLDCLQNDVKNDNDISTGCQNFLWSYKKNLTTDMRFDSAASEVCKDALKELPDCGNQAQGTGFRISCLIEHKANVSSANCRQFLTKMASIVFSDYRLISSFADACNNDITKLKCGRTSTDNSQVPHSQGLTIECLSERYTELNDQCKHEIVRVAELQSDDFHSDRALYYACREDRERFCARTKAGGGKVYKCLYRHKFDRDMSRECREKLVVRQTLARESIKVNKAFSEACRQDMRTYRCMKGDVPSGFRQAKLAHVLLCLEGAMREGNSVTPECIAELKEVRRSLMEDYKISPQIVTSCHQEIHAHCYGGLHREGKTVHCLMDLARPRRKDRDSNKIEGSLSDQCKRSLEELLKEVDVGEDYSMDPALQEACQPVVDVGCKHIKPGDAKVISCLMEKIGTDKMNDDCEERLMEIQYFIARDFKLDPRLYKNCHRDAMKYCHADEHWDSARGPSASRMVFACLYQQNKVFSKDADRQLSRACAFEVNRIMRQRAVSVELEPRIEEPCLQDLGTYCSTNVMKGEEMRCLTAHYKELELACKWAVGNYTEDVDKDPSLDHILMKSCTPMIKAFCSEEVNQENAEPGDVMECLIKHKHSADMNRKCAVGIEHHQLVTMTDYQFSYKFKEACKADVLKLCKGARRKSDVVRCLSEVHRNDTLLEREGRLSRPCRKQLRFELLQRGESIRLDSVLDEACKSDQAQFCGNVSPGNAQIIECLKKHQKDLSSTCARKLFKREKMEAVDNAVDFVMMTNCKSMIKLHCRDERKRDLEMCLRNHVHDDDFDDKCKKVLKVKHIRSNKDYRLNVGLSSACKMDIPKFCKAELEHRDQDQMLEGKVISCLKVKFVARRLSRDCEDHIRVIIKEAALNYKQDPVLAANCQEEIRTHCLQSVTNSDDDDGYGGVEECLKRKFAEKKITRQQCTQEILRILNEMHADVHVDPLLHRACALDIKHYCFDVQPGQGRHMSCLLHALEDKTVRLKVDCRKMLRDRVTMWEYAAKVAPPESMVELAQQIHQSKNRNYFFFVILAVLGVIFFGGLFCGRVTKRVRAELKDK